ncbi:MAG: N-acetylmuramoyl-L-alanine amidase [Bryobacteraceae bacterium]|nr:N-acetylmuramoyl-L-alanine amidase [Bryobacteraceae bacterium]MDW8377855.1 N-acetylmuramoyl-L-alanine amidase [Bryobacterales bacterium]
MPSVLVVLVALAASLLLGEERFESQEWRLNGAGRAPLPFRAVGVYASVEVQVRASQDGQRWTEWHTAYPHEEGALIYFGLLSHYLETSAPARILLIDPGSTPQGGAKRLMRPAADAPPIVPREQWGCTPQTCPVRSAPTYTTPTHLIVHHSAGGNQSSDWAAVVRAIWILHVQGNGWNDIGYNYLIDPNGVLYEGRAGGDGVVGAHFSGVNSATVGVCLLGTYSTLGPQPAALDTLRQLIAWQSRKWGIDPGGRSLHVPSGLVLNHISGHRDAGLSPRASSTTECPGNGLYVLLPEIRRQVRAAVEGACPLRIQHPTRCLGAGAQSVDVAVEIAASCQLSVQSQNDWIAASPGPLGIRLEVAPNRGSARSGAVKINGQRVEIHQAPAGESAPPCIHFDGIVNAASFDDRPLAPNSLFTIFGEGFAEEPIQSASSSWPTQLGEVTVLVNDKPVPVGFVSPGQINVQLPVVNLGSARISVRRREAASPERLLWVTEASPAIFAAWIEEPGHVSIYYTGGGRNTPPPLATIGNRSAERVGVEPAPGLPGVQRAVFRLPEDFAADAEVRISVAGAVSPAVRLAASP